MEKVTIQDIFEMRKNGQFEEAYAAVLPMYREHHGHYTTLCMFWTATDVCRLRIEKGRFEEAEQMIAALRNLYPSLQDRDGEAAKAIERLEKMLERYKANEGMPEPEVKQPVMIDLDKACAWWESKCDAYGLSLYKVELFRKAMMEGK